jgi:O-antigen ligase
LGIPAALCLFSTLLWMIALCVRGIRKRRRDAVYPCLGLAASALVGLHAIVDFSLQIPAVTMLFMTILGVAVAQSRSSQPVDGAP